MEKSDYRLLPLAAVGLTLGVIDVYVKPFIKEQVVKKVAQAAIHYYPERGQRG